MNQGTCSAAISVAGESSSANAGRGPGAGECAALDAAMERSAVEALAGEEPAPLILIDGKRRRTWTGLRHDLCCGAARPSAIGMLVSRVVGSITPTTTGQRACPLYLSSESGVFGSQLSRLTGRLPLITFHMQISAVSLHRNGFYDRC